MNAKKLRQAAELATEWDGYIHPENKPAFDAWKLLANHTLATVREDDDEVLSREWLMSVAEFQCAYELYAEYVVELRSGAEFKFRASVCEYCSRDGESLCEIKTRGEFRALCRLLGKKLKEDV